MKRFVFLIALTTSIFTANTVSAQDKMLLNHLSVGLEVGTTGWGLEAAAPVSPFVTLRTGFTTMPKFKYTESINYDYKNVSYSVDVQGHLNMFDWKLLADVYPFRQSSFHLTAGFYAGQKDIVKVKNTGEIKGVGTGEGIVIGGEDIQLDDLGLIHLRSKTNAFKPYLGLGFGRPISKNNKVSVAFDLGVQFWGKPALQVHSFDKDGWVSYKKDDVKDEDLNDAIKTLEKITVYPVLNLRIYFNAF